MHEDKIIFLLRELETERKQFESLVQETKKLTSQAKRLTAVWSADLSTGKAFLGK